MKAAVFALFGIALVWVLTITVVSPFAIPTNSMEPTMVAGDRILVNRLAYVGAFRTPIGRGDVIVFNGQDSFTSAEKDYVKRVVGIGGDRVKCCDSQGFLLVNGAKVDESQFVFPGDSPSEILFDIEVPEGDLWLMGDHRSQSADSRSHLGDPGGGLVPESKVIGRASLVVWPPSRWQSIE